MELRPVPAESFNKRPRSPSDDFPPLASKVARTHTNHLQINYLARQFSENIPLVSPEDNMRSILGLIGDYDGVLQRHESIAGNLGACPLGPILVKRFERLFDGPPRVLKSHGKEGSSVTWLDIVEFAKNKPEQFNLERTRNGVRVCQFYTKQSRVEISEEDYVLISSGMPQKMIPPQPIIEDEEKELGALEILEKNLGQIIHLADQVSARARQLNHRLKNRRNAILARRETDVTLKTQGSPPRETNGNGAGGHQGHPPSPPSGFVAVNARQTGLDGAEESSSAASQFMFSHPNTDNVTIINGTSIKGASPTTRADLMKKFFTTADRHARGLPVEEDGPPPSSSGGASQTSARPRPRVSEPGEYAPAHASGTVPIPNTPTSLLPQPKSAIQQEKDDGGPFKMEMVSRMEELQRGQRVMPPCDRCRRLHMDCLKNLTACMGCTKKHAKCSWKDVKDEELRERPASDEVPPHMHQQAEIAVTPPEHSHQATEQPPPYSNPGATNSAPSTRPASEPQQGAREALPRRAASENHPPAASPGRPYGPDRSKSAMEEDQDDFLAKAIMDTVDQHLARQAAAERRRESETMGERERQ